MVDLIHGVIMKVINNTGLSLKDILDLKIVAHLYGKRKGHVAVRAIDGGFAIVSVTPTKINPNITITKERLSKYKKAIAVYPDTYRMS
jgi:hypothetical protein